MEESRGIRCYHCESEKWIRKGYSRNKKQRYQCKQCGRLFVEDPEWVQGYSEERKGEVKRAYLERMSLRGAERVFKIPRKTIKKWIKQASSKPLSESLMKSQAKEEIEADELCGHVYRRKAKVWVWLGFCRRTQQIVGYALGTRTDETCQKWWASLPPSYQLASFFTDHWQSYTKVIPTSQPIACNKKSGQTNHIERFNNTLRQRLGCLTRETLSFCKTLDSLHCILSLFIFQYNLNIIKNYR